jgi:hypothetical protein
MTSAAERQIDALYALPPGEFTRARDDLAKRLRADERRDDADAVKGLRSPTLPAWTANQLARRRAADVKRLVKAGADYRRTQKPEALRAERAALSALVSAGRDILREAGREPSDSVIARVRATLQAAAADEDAAAAVVAGRLARELEPEALEALLAAGAAALEHPRRAGKPAARAKRDDRAAREALREAKAAARAAEREERQARRAWETAQRRLDEARARVADAERKLG